MESTIIPTTFKLPKQTKEQIEYLKDKIIQPETLFPGSPKITAVGVVCYVIHQAFLAEQAKDEEIKTKLQKKKSEPKKKAKETKGDE